MPSILIRLEAERLDDPDLDLRYVLPDTLATRTGVVRDDGYDYGDETGAMLVFLTTELDAAAAAARVVEALREPVMGNVLVDRCVVATSPDRHADPAGTWTVVHAPYPRTGSLFR